MPRSIEYPQIHTKPIIFHRDIKSSNILLDHKFESRVGDFGLARVMDMPRSTTMSVVAVAVLVDILLLSMRTL
ncbi:unnamed protein product [Malus baccata var. baccata]